MTAVSDAKSSLEAAKGSSMTPAALTRVASKAAEADPYSMAAFATPGSPTKEEAAQLLLDTWIQWLKDVVGQTVDRNSDRTNAVQKASDRAAAEADLD